MFLALMPRGSVKRFRFGSAREPVLFFRFQGEPVPVGSVPLKHRNRTAVPWSQRREIPQPYDFLDHALFKKNLTFLVVKG